MYIYILYIYIIYIIYVCMYIYIYIYIYIYNIYIYIYIYIYARVCVYTLNYKLKPFLEIFINIRSSFLNYQSFFFQYRYTRCSNEFFTLFRTLNFVYIMLKIQR